MEKKGRFLLALLPMIIMGAMFLFISSPNGMSKSFVDLENRMESINGVVYTQGEITEKNYNPNGSVGIFSSPSKSSVTIKLNDGSTFRTRADAEGFFDIKIGSSAYLTINERTQSIKGVFFNASDFEEHVDFLRDLRLEKGEKTEMPLREILEDKELSSIVNK